MFRGSQIPVLAKHHSCLPVQCVYLERNSICTKYHVGFKFTHLTSLSLVQDVESGLEESKFKSRKCSTRFKQQRLIETLTLNSSRSKLHTFVVASGLLYGQGEDVLHPQFKVCLGGIRVCELHHLMQWHPQAAWHAESSPLKYIGEGDNVIPMIHVDDFSNIVCKTVTAKSISLANSLFSSTRSSSAVSKSGPSKGTLWQ